MGIIQRKLAVVIGINQYQHGISPLSTAVQDATKLSKLLAETYHYKVLNLFDQQADLTGLRHLLEQKLPEEIKPTENDQLLFYFAGHGTALQSDHGPAGYVVPQDAKPETPEMFLPMQDLHRALSDLDCRHFLAIFDCCFAGTFRWASTRDILATPEKVYKERYARYRDFPAWQVITSASYNQKALDIFRDNRGKTAQDERHSPFATALFDALQGEADLIPDGIITATEIYLYLRDRVEDISEAKQTPGLWPLEKHDRGEYIFLMDSFDEEDLDDAPELKPENNPYRGLEAFDELHGALFFGRDQLVKDLYDQVKDNSLTAVLGASGTGKSSLVKAGLIPYLKQAEFLKKRRVLSENLVQENWHVLEPLRPGNDPLTALAQIILPISSEPVNDDELKAIEILDELILKPTSSLPEAIVIAWQDATALRKLGLIVSWTDITENHLDDDTVAQQAFESLQGYAQTRIQDLRKTLKTYPKALTRFLGGWIKSNPNDKFLLIIDQSEEFVTQVLEEGERHRFLENLEDVLVKFPQQFRCLLTLRLDFEPLVKTLLSTPLTKDWAEEKRFVVPPMSQDELRDAIEKPALEKALYFEPPQLVDMLINEVVQMPGALPLLSFTLSELYIKCFERFRNSTEKDIQNRALIEEDYKDLQGVVGALRKRANQEFDEMLNEAEQTTMRNVMLRMVTLEGGELARRRVPKSELEYADADENDRVEKVVDHFVAQRLFVTSTTTEGEYIEPAHDALVRGWEKISLWLNEKKSAYSKSNLMLLQKTTAATLNWQELSENSAKKGNQSLWDRNPLLAQVESIQKIEDNWLNAQESIFIKNSIDKRKTNKLIRAILLGVFITGISIAGMISFHQRNIALSREINALNTSSLLQLSSNQELEALTTAARAGFKMQENQIWLSKELKQQTIDGLLTVVDQTREVNRFEGHTGIVTDISVSSDGQYVASSSDDTSIKLWSVSGKLINNLMGHSDRVNSIAFSPDNKLLVSSSADGTAKIWTLDGGNIHTLNKKHTNDFVVRASFSPDSRQVLFASNDGMIKIWNLTDGSVRFLGRHQNAWVTDIGFSTDGQLIVSSDRNGIVKIWDINGKLMRSFRAHQGAVRSLAFNSDLQKQYFASASEDNTIKIWDVSGSILQKINLESTINDIAFHPLKPNIFSLAGDDGIVKSFKSSRDEINFEHLDTWRGNNTRINSITYANHGKYIYTAEDKTIRVWLSTKRNNIISLDKLLPTKSSRVKSIDSDHTGDLIVYASGGTIYLWDKTLDQSTVIPNFNKDFNNNINVLKVEFFPKSDTLIYSFQRQDEFERGGVYLWDLKRQVNHKVFDLAVVNDISISNNQDLIALSSDDSIIYLINREGDILRRLSGHKKSVLGVSISPNTKLITSSDINGLVKLWTIEGQELQTFNEHTDWVWKVNFSIDSKMIASAGQDGKAHVWDIMDKRLIHSFSGHDGPVLNATFSPDNKYLVTSGLDRSIRFWSLDSGKLIQTLNTHEGGISDISFSSDSRNFLSSDLEGFIRAWTYEGNPPILPIITLNSLNEYSCHVLSDYLQNSLLNTTDVGKYCKLNNKKSMAYF